MTRHTLLAAALLLPQLAMAGGGPANTLVLYNGDDAEALGTAEHYAQARQLPPGHLCAVSGVDPTARTMPFDDYSALVLTALDACLDALPQPDEVDYLVVVRGLPYRVDLSAFSASLSAILQVYRAEDRNGDMLAGKGQYKGGYYAASVSNPLYLNGSAYVNSDYNISNPYQSSYASAPRIVRLREQPEAFTRAANKAGFIDFTGNLFVVGRLDGYDHADARALVDRAIEADGAFPEDEILCMHGADSARGARDPECEFVTRMLTEGGFNATWLPEWDGELSAHTLMGMVTGAADAKGTIDGNTYAPGAVAGNLTSTGAAPGNFFCNEDGTECPASESQTSIARWVRAGASAAHGAVAEPLNNSFPNAGFLLHYTMGYSYGESNLFSQRYLYWQNIYLGDPLLSPWADRPVVALEEPREGVVYPQNLPLLLSASHDNGVAELIAYVDGVRTASASTDSLDLDLSDFEVGQRFELLLVGVAANIDVERPGWVESTTLARPNVQGWATFSVEVGEPVEQDTDTGDTDVPMDEGCGCAAASGLSWAWLAVAGLLGLRRRS